MPRRAVGRDSDGRPHYPGYRSDGAPGGPQNPPHPSLLTQRCPQLCAEKGNGTMRGTTTWALDMCPDLRKRDAGFRIKFNFLNMAARQAFSRVLYGEFGRMFRHPPLVIDRGTPWL